MGRSKFPGFDIMVCLVTGSSRGLGKAVALEFGKRGHCVVIHCREKRKEAEAVSSQINKALVLQADVRKYHEVKSLVSEIINTYGTIDVLVNNAGVTIESLLLKTAESVFDDVINTNLKGPYHFIRIVGHHMAKQRAGHIINISSYAGIKGKEGLAAYSASKSGLIGLTRTAAQELSRFNIMVNAVLPGYMLTDMGTGSSVRAKENAFKESLVKEFSNPKNVAEFICTVTEMNGITGQVFNLDSRIL
jgi:3-oxoacyl-[acyl-carrier protein] reductase